MRFLTTILLLAILTSCSKKSDVEKYAEKEDWDSYQVTGFCWFGCSKDDFYQTSFTAIKNGKEFEGCTCSGFFFKNTTLRLE